MTSASCPQAFACHASYIALPKPCQDVSSKGSTEEGTAARTEDLESEMDVRDRQVCHNVFESVFVFVCVAMKWWCTYQRACWVVPRVNRLAIWWRGWLGPCCVRLDGGTADHSALHPAPRAHTAANEVWFS